MRVGGILWRCWDRGLFLIKKNKKKIRVAIESKSLSSGAM